jgi:integrase
VRHRRYRTSEAIIPSLLLYVEPHTAAGPNLSTLRRTFSIWSHKSGILPKDLAEFTGHADVNMQFEYSVGQEANKQLAAARLEQELVSFGHILPVTFEMVN